MSFSLHAAAGQDLAEAARFYRREAGRGIALRFLAEFDRVAALLAREPGLGTPTDGQRRGFPLHGFPYTLIYSETTVGVRILVVRHQHRDPDHGSARR